MIRASPGWRLVGTALIGMAIGACSKSPPAVATSPRAATDDMSLSTLRAEGLDPSRIEAGIRDVSAGHYGNIHSLLIFRHGKLVSESYFPGEDENNHKGRIGLIQHGPQTLHDIRSVSKTIVALALLKAHEQGRIKSLDQPLYDYFPEYAASYDDPVKAQITIRHALTMTAGLDWNEDVPYAHPDSSPAKLQRAADPLDFVFGRDMVAAPGTQFTYNGGLTQILAAIVERATLRDVEQFTKDELYSGLDIHESEWAKRPDGKPDADSGARLRARDMAKIGLLLANKGSWNGRQILSPELIADAVAEHVVIPQDPEAAAGGDLQGYGYQIWRFSYLTDRERIHLIELSGNGGQKVYIDDNNQLMVVTTAGDYDRRDLKKYPLDIYIDVVQPALVSR